jgi:hypothetical protein
MEIGVFLYDFHLRVVKSLDVLCDCHFAHQSRNFVGK